MRRVSFCAQKLGAKVGVAFRCQAGHQAGRACIGCNGCVGWWGCCPPCRGSFEQTAGKRCSFLSAVCLNTKQGVCGFCRRYRQLNCMHPVHAMRLANGPLLPGQLSYSPEHAGNMALVRPHEPARAHSPLPLIPSCDKPAHSPQHVPTANAIPHALTHTYKRTHTMHAPTHA